VLTPGGSAVGSSNFLNDFGNAERYFEAMDLEEARKHATAVARRIQQNMQGDQSEYAKLRKDLMGEASSMWTSFRVWEKNRETGTYDGYRARIRNHGHSCFLCEIVIRSQFHTTYEPEA
jgi:hypothetical protein